MSKVPVGTLLVEDNNDVLASMVYVLEQAPHLKYVITTARSFLEAESHLQGTYFDIVILDLTLPDKGGIDLLRDVRRLSPMSAVVVVTGDGSDETQLLCLAEGVQEYFVKGKLDTDEIIRRLRRVVVSHMGFVNHLFGPLNKAVADGYARLLERKSK